MSSAEPWCRPGSILPGGRRDGTSYLWRKCRISEQQPSSSVARCNHPSWVPIYAMSATHSRLTVSGVKSRSTKFGAGVAAASTTGVWTRRGRRCPDTPNSTWFLSSQASGAVRRSVWGAARCGGAPPGRRPSTPAQIAILSWRRCHPVPHHVGVLTWDRPVVPRPASGGGTIRCHGQGLREALGLSIASRWHLVHGGRGVIRCRCDGGALRPTVCLRSGGPSGSGRGLRPASGGEGLGAAQEGADVRRPLWRRQRHLARVLVEAGREDVLDRPVARVPEGARPSAGRVQPRAAEGGLQVQDALGLPQARTDADLQQFGPRGQDLRSQLLGLRPVPGGVPAEEGNALLGQIGIVQATAATGYARVRLDQFRLPGDHRHWAAGVAGRGAGTRVAGMATPVRGGDGCARSGRSVPNRSKHGE